MVNKAHRLSDVITLIGGGTPKRSISEYWDGDIPWLSVKDFNHGGRYVEKSDETITSLGLEKSSTKLLQPGMLIISARGTVGELAQLKSSMAFNQSCYGIDAKKHYLDNDYLYYLLKLKIGELKSIAHGSVFDTITRDTFENIEVELPSKEAQKAIAQILGTLDDKIELNQKMNQTLEEIAKAIFKSWFVDFDPVRAKAEGRPTGLPPEISDLFPDELVASEIGEIPKGWEVYRFTDTFEFFSGGTPKTSVEEYWGGNIPWFSIADLNAFSPWVTKTEKSITELGLSKCSAKLINSRTTIVTARGTVGKVALAGQDMAINQSCYAMAATTGYPYTWLYLQTLALVDQLRANAHGSVFDTITRSTFEQFLVLSAPKTVFAAFTEITSPLFERMRTSDLESKTLCELRDTLLPKLISGELRIPNAEKFLEEAGL
jgi:type I restriction enzyme S subunit